MIGSCQRKSCSGALVTNISSWIPRWSRQPSGRLGLVLARLLVLLGLLTCSPAAHLAAQTLPLSGKVRLERVAVGFPSGTSTTDPGLCKAGLWTPVFFTLHAGSEGTPLIPEKDGKYRGTIWLLGLDSDGSPNAYPCPFALEEGRSAALMGYFVPGALEGEVRLELSAAAVPRRQLLGSSSWKTLPLGASLYLSAGPPVPELEEGLRQQEQSIQVAQVRQVEQLPEQWFGYQGVDWLLLAGNEASFLRRLRQEKGRLQALATWVAQGGRLLLHLSAGQEQEVQRLLTAPVWEPALPPLLAPTAAPRRLTSGASLQNWARVGGVPFPVSRQEPFALARLQACPEAEILCRDEETGQPILLRLPWGRGQISLLAFALDAPAFRQWAGRWVFWQALRNALAPHTTWRHPPLAATAAEDAAQDIGAFLARHLEQFEGPAISFGWLAVLLLAYIVLVGPVEYVLLRKVGRLEATWLTFPLGILLIGGLCLGLLHRKGTDWRLTRLELVDVDQRRLQESPGLSPAAPVAGTSWLGLFSAQAAVVHLGVQPVLTGWGEPRGAAQVLLQGLGRAEPGAGGLGRRRRTPLYHHTYRYAGPAHALEEVPLLIWSSRCFLAQWQLSLSPPPLRADLFYRPPETDLLAGTLENASTLQLQNVYLFYGNRVYPLPDLLPGQPLKLVLDPRRVLDVSRWASSRQDPFRLSEGTETEAETADLGWLLKRLLVAEYLAQANHAFRYLDQSWRLHEPASREEQMREALLLARLPPLAGRYERFALPADPRCPTRLLLEPCSFSAAEALPAVRLQQETWVRFFLPVRPRSP
jgi:hypothetical protein